MIFFCPLIFSQWQWQNPLPQGNSINEIKFVDQNTGFAVGNGGTIMKTTDYGQNWLLVSSNSIENIKSLFIVNSNVIYSNSTYEIIKSTDGGNTWSSVFFNSAGYMQKLFFINQNTGFAAGSNKIAKTTDGALSWVVYNIPGSNTISDIFFPNENTGFACSNSGFYKSTNGGVDWNIVSISAGFSKFDFVNSNTGYGVSSDGKIHKTTDQCSTWTIIYSNPSYYFQAISHADENNLIAAGNNGLILHSTNAGLNWINISYSEPINFYTCYYNISSGMLAAGLDGKIIFRQPNGSNWISQNRGEFKDINNCFFINSFTGFAAGKKGTLYKTSNRGLNWQTVLIDTSKDIYDVKFIDQNTGFIAGTNGFFYKTINSGSTWVGIPSSYSFYCISFINENTGFAGTSNNTYILKTSDSGNNWSFINLNNGIIRDIDFVNAQTGYLITGLNNIYKTTDQGFTWILNYQPPQGIDFQEIDFANENTGYVTNLSMGRMYKTTNAGNDWNFFNVNANFKPSSVDFIDAGNGFSGGVYSLPSGLSCAAVCRTTNGGINWTIEYPHMGINMLCLFAISPDTCYIMGNSGAILYRAGSIIGINKIYSNIPDDFSLHQNFPNPFNPATKIRFDIKNNSYVSLKVYDVTGKIVKFLVDQNLFAGSYSVDFNASEFTSGVYLYELTVRQDGSSTVDYKETKKMVLVK